ncbi:flagellar assembly protein FliW [Lentisphaerota bacterium WC36G]|nr:flagellar assembly protein FliW [Lentisphaerae bacterium WC36]
MSKSIDFANTTVLKIGSGNRCVSRDVAKKHIINFPKGLIGFNDLKNFVVMINKDIAPFMFLQSLDNDDINFVCIESFNIKENYSFNLNDNIAERLEINDMSDVLLLSIVTISQNIEESTANLLSPVIINMNNMQAEQIILDSTHYPVQLNIWNNIIEMQAFAQ